MDMGHSHRMGAICVPRTLWVQACIKINYKIHFNIKQSVLHINLTANVKYIIKTLLKTTQNTDNIVFLHVPSV